MSYVITSSEYLELDSVPLNTPAWDVLNWADLYSGQQIRGTDLIVPSRPGQIAARRVYDAKASSLPIIFYSDKKYDGTAHTDMRQGLIDNIDDFKKLLLNVPLIGDGTKTMKIHSPSTLGTVRKADIHVSPDLQLQSNGAGSLTGLLNITNPSGIWRDVTATTDNNTVSGTSGSFTVTVPGTGMVFDSTITITGAATNLKLISTTFDSSGNTYVQITTPISTDAVLDCADAQLTVDSVRKDGYIKTSGTSLILPLVSGTNTISFTKTGSGSIDIDVELYGAWL